jgi:DivIVA domain-containing protein
LALRRQDIERTEFPIARRGYDPEAVDAHLRSLADRLDEQGASAASLAGAASEQVKAIVTAAEATAADIRAKADEEARSHVTQVEEAAKAMLQRIDELESELGRLVETLREGAGRLAADLAQVRAGMAELRPAGDEAGDEDEDARAAAALEAAAAEAADKGPTVEPPAHDGGSAQRTDDTEGARLIALNMALNGTPREETDRYLEENFQLEDRAALLDEVYAQVG